MFESMIGGSGLCLLITAVIAFQIVIFCFFLQPFKDHFGIGFGFAHLVLVQI